MTPTERKAYQAMWRQSHPNYHKEWSLSHPDYYKEYRAVHQKELLISEAKCRQKHQEEIKARKKANSLKARTYTAKRRALKREMAVGTLDYAAIIARDKGVCGICHRKVKRSGLHFDHIVPLSKGGAHAEHNIQVAHAFCNRSKHNSGKLPSQTRLPF